MMACGSSLVRLVLTAAVTLLCAGSLFVGGASGSSASPGVNNWAVIVSTSRFWHNYRHSANALSFYHLCKQNGIPDSRILLFLADTVACNPRNLVPGTVYNNNSRRTNLYRCDTQVDFSGYSVNTHTLLSVLQGRFDASRPQSRRLMSDANSNLLVYLTGHGGEGFLKFQDTEYLYSEEIGTAFTLLHAQRMYRKALFVVETCHAESLCLAIRAPNVACVGSSTISEDSYSHHQDPDLGIDVIDTFTSNTLSQLDGVVCPGGRSDTAHRITSPDEHARIFKSRTTDVYNIDLLSFFRRKGVSYRGAYRGPVNNPTLLSQWTVGEFFCDNGDLMETVALPKAL